MSKSPRTQVVMVAVEEAVKENRKEEVKNVTKEIVENAEIVVLPKEVRTSREKGEAKRTAVISFS